MTDNLNPDYLPDLRLGKRDNDTMVAVTPELERARAICSAHYRKRARDPRNSYGHEMAHAARIDDGQSDDWDCVQTTLTALTEASRHQSGRTGAGEALREAARAVLADADRPGSRMLLGDDKTPDGWIEYREVGQAELNALAAALSQSTAGEDGA